MEIARVSKRFSFDAAHFLPGYNGKCANLHGHTWGVEVTVEGAVDPLSGMVIDFIVLKKIVEPWIEKLDHHYLNDILPMPTAENITLWFLGLWNAEPRPVKLVSIKVWESPDSAVEWVDES